MTDVKTWLESLGLEQYVEAFMANDIDAELLAELSDDALQVIGVASVGHRLRMLKAVRQLASSTAVSPARPDGETVASEEAERRQLTVMFCDLVGSVALGEQMDLEDYRDLLERFRQASVGAVERFEGFVARHQGDGLLAYFGYPRGHEDDAERAVRAGLALLDSVRALAGDGGVDMAVRVGIATGPVVVGDLLRTGASSELAALGPGANLAARLQGAAEPNTVLIAESTHAVVRGRFVAKAKPELELKGFELPVLAHEVTADAGQGARVATRSGTGLSPLVGRRAELALLEDRWLQAEAGAGQVVLISAEAGVGKSRLIHEFEIYARARGAHRIRVQCSPFHSSAAFYPVLDAIERAARLFECRDATTRLERLERWLGSLGLDSGRAIPLLAPLLSMPMSGQEESAELPAEQRRRRVLETFAEIVRRMNMSAPVLLIAEDLHWVDPSTEALFGHLLVDARNQRLLGLFSSPPEYRSPWPLEAHVTAFSLNHLTAPDCRQLVGDAVRRLRLPAALVDQIVERSDGVPLYAEEIVGALSEGSKAADAVIPATLREALTARLDNAGDAKRIAQIASVIGRSFDVRLVERVAGASMDTREALERLLASGLVRRLGSSHGEQLEFKHQLVRDAAYDSLLRSRRRELHAAVFDTLGAESGERSDVLAEHAFRGELWEQAGHHALEAGRRAIRASAFEEARAHLNRTLDALARRPPDPTRSRAELDVHIELRRAVGALADYDAVRKVLAAAVRLATELNDPRTLANLNADLTHVLYHLGHVHQSLEVGVDAVAAAGRAHDRPAEVHAISNLAMARLWHGDLTQAIELACSVQADLEGPLRNARFGGTWPSAALWLGNLCGMHAMCGNFADAVTVGREAMAIGETSGIPFGGVPGASWLGWALAWQGRVADALVVLEPAATIAENEGSDFALSWARFTLGFAVLLDGGLEAAIELLEASLGEFEHKTTAAMRNFSVVSLAWARLESGSTQECAALIEPWLASSRAAGFGNLAPTGLRLLANAIARGNAPDLERAQALAVESITLAERCGARPDVAHGAATRAALFRQLGQAEAAARCRASAERQYRSLDMPYWAARLRDTPEI